jgi:hypothetical protein
MAVTTVDAGTGMLDAEHMHAPLKFPEGALTSACVDQLSTRAIAYRATFKFTLLISKDYSAVGNRPR